MKQYLQCAMDIGEQMLVSGAEVHRVEDSVTRLCKAFGAKRIDVFIITSSMVVTIFDEEGKSYTQTRRIMGTGTDMEKLHRLNHLSRKACKEQMSIAEIQMELKQCTDSKPYPFWVICFVYALIAAAFTAFFGGNVKEIIASPIVGFGTSFVVHFSERIGMNTILEKFICSFWVTVCAFVFMRTGFIGTVDKVIIGNIMTLIPGIGLTSALRDLFTGDSIAGLLRSVEAVLNALAISAGYFLFVWLMGGAFV